MSKLHEEGIILSLIEIPQEKIQPLSIPKLSVTVIVQLPLRGVPKKSLKSPRGSYVEDISGNNFHGANFGYADSKKEN